MEARALWQTSLGDRLPRPHRRQVLQGRRRRTTGVWGWDLRYALLFPNDITYTIGKSDYHKDWFFEEVPHAESTDWINPDAKDPANQPFGWVKTLPDGSPDPWRQWGQGRATTWTIKFNVDKAEHGQAALRVALAGADGAGGLGSCCQRSKRRE